MALSNQQIAGIGAASVLLLGFIGSFFLPKDAETQRKEQIKKDSEERIAAFEAREAAEAAAAKAAPPPAPASTGARRKTRRRKSRKSSRRK